MAKTVIGTYRDMESAVAVVNRLVDAGFSRNDISVIANDRDNQYKGYLDRDDETDDVAKGAGIGAAIGGLGGLLVGLGALAIPGIGPVIAAGPIAAALAGAGIGAVAGGVIGALVDLGIPEDEAHLYAESVRRGNVLVAAQVSDSRADEASRIMDSAGLIDLERQAEDWRASGWTGFQAQGGSYQGNGQSNKPRGEDIAYNQTARNTHTQSTSQRHDNLTDGDDTIEVVEEDIRIGKRNVEEGGVRVRSYVREVPVEEEVRLREERVHVERRPVDRPATAQDLNSFREGTVEIRESHEEPVISKEARVVEEVHIHKDVE
jgi:stress response protein YsnF